MNRLRSMLYVSCGILVILLIFLMSSGIHYPHMRKDIASEIRIERGLMAPIHRWMFTGVDFMYPTNLVMRVPETPALDYEMTGYCEPYVVYRRDAELYKKCALQIDDPQGTMPLYFIPLARYDFFKIIVVSIALLVTLSIICVLDAVTINGFRVREARESRKPK